MRNKPKRENVVHAQNGILCSHKENEIVTFVGKWDAARNKYVKQNKPY